MYIKYLERMTKSVYFDNAATTQVYPHVVKKMLPYFLSQYANPSSSHSAGQNARKDLEKARTQLARLFRVSPSEICYTSGATEANNWAIRGCLRNVKTANKNAKSKKANKMCHIITSSIEHPAVRNTLRDVPCSVTEVPLDKNGRVDVVALEKAIRPNTAMITVMAINNEVGTIQPIAEIGRIAKRHHIPFHCDATQMAGKIPIYPKKMGITTMAMSGHKAHGPKGIGALFIDKSYPLCSCQTGGGHEHRKRAGTENVPSIIGMTEAFAYNLKPKQRATRHIQSIRTYLKKELQKLGCIIHEAPAPYQSPYIIHCSVPYSRNNQIIKCLNKHNIFVNVGSACGNGKSHVLTAMRISPKEQKGALRISLSSLNTMKDAQKLITCLRMCLSQKCLSQKCSRKCVSLKK